VKKIKAMVRTSTLALALALGAGSVASISSFDATAQWAVFDPTNYIQNYMQQVRATQSNVNEAMQIAYQLQQYQTMLQNTKSLTKGDIDNAADAIDRLGRVMAQGKAIAVTSQHMQQQFRTMFPGYEPQQDYQQRYSEWNTTTLDSVLGAMSVANLQTTGIADEQRAIASLRQAALSTDGQKQAIDAANLIALQQVRQMQSLRELQVAQMQAEGTYLAAQTQEKENRRGIERAATRYRDPRQGYVPRKVCATPPCN
jgi:P-type conjugative transfer protein TrbJ